MKRVTDIDLLPKVPPPASGADYFNPMPLSRLERWDILKVDAFKFSGTIYCGLCGERLEIGQRVIDLRYHAEHFLTAYYVDEARGGWSRGGR